ncbi:MAG: M1 family aminopeptidase [Gemmatimonadetes bacterium]|nr:M1 family aminopeptidase [Gemmatimonadota bacterium]MDA1102301.1 M1 family aminopeptidase [Gemmatimonadota bacterium]
MFWPILRFEIVYHVRRPVTYLYFSLLFLFGFFLIASDAIVVVGGVGLVKRNSPYALAQAMIAVTAIGTVITTALVGTSLLRDFRYQVHELLFTTSMTRLGYLSGRFFGAFLVMVFVFSGIPFGSLLGTLAPWVDPQNLLPVNPWFHFQPFLLFSVTTLLVVSAIFFAVGALTRSLVAVYVQGIALLVAWSVTQTWLQGLDRDAVANAFDIFGISTLELTTRYWTVAERNSMTIPLEGFVLVNRSIWIAVGLLIAGVTFALFRFEAGTNKATKKSKKIPLPPPAPVGATAKPQFGTGTSWRQFVGTTSSSFRHIVRDKTFIAIALIASIDASMSAWYADQLYGVTTWPVTYLVAEVLATEFYLFMVILTTIFAGEAVWRERGLGADQLVDAAPVQTGVVITGKIVSVILALGLVFLVMVPVGITVQVVKGFTDVDVGLYFTFLGGTLLPWAIAVTLFAFAVHSLAQNKFVGHLVLIVYWIGSIVVSNLGVEHQLAGIGWVPGFRYSEMNGFGHFVSNLALSGSYSIAFGLMVTVLAGLAWARGTEKGWRLRLQEARGRWTPRTGLALGGCALLVLVFGGAIFYNTNVLNTYTTSDEREELLAEWERTYRPFIHLVPPRIVDVDVTAELWPERRAYSLDGTYVIVNKTDTPIDSVIVNYDQNLTVERMAWSAAATGTILDSITGTQLWTFTEALQPGDTTELTYRFSLDAVGFPNSAPNNRIVANGTFLASLGPSLGYDESNEMSNPSDRRKHDLPERNRLPDLDDPSARANPQFTIDSDLVNFAITVATAPNQIAVAPGYLQREWEENGRRWFRYEMDRPIARFVSVVSAEYAVARDRWNDVDITIYHHETHDYNIDRMIESIKASLEYYSESFSPYQYKEVRILEFPRYSGFAQSFSTTIPYSESIGFITRVEDDDDDLDMPFFVTAHEVAHQWWGHQVVGARAQGSAIMVESMAEYAALTVMEKRYGASHARKFLRFELDRYLRGRAVERIREQPLIRTENQAYIHYYKGSLALYALRDYIGEEAMNRGLRGYIADHAFESAPYSTSRDFLGYLRAETPDSLQYVIEDLFETITLWDNKVDEISVEARDDGRYALTLDFSSRKVRADSLGNETDVPMSDYIDVGVFGPEEPGNSLGRPLSVYKIHVTENQTSVEIIVDEEPVKAGIDPYNKLIDRVPGDNVKNAPRGT